MGAVYKSICNEADTLLLHIIDLTEKQVALKLEMETLMNKGFVSIAKARYIMGSTCVTKMQLPTEKSNPIKPLVTVDREPVDNYWVFKVSRPTKTDSFVSEVSEPSEPSENVEEEAVPSEEKISMGSESENFSNNMSITSVDKSEAAFRKVLQDDPKSLKRSKIAYPVKDDMYQEYNDELLDEMSNSGSNESLVSVTDPIRLFGILVPGALKQGQSFFIKVVEKLGECASIQSELRGTLNKYSHLQRCKNLIEAAAKDMKMDFLTPKLYWSSPESSTVSYHSVHEEELEEEKSESSVSVQKSIRSVFYDYRGEQPEGEDWGSGRSVFKSDDYED